MRAGRLDESVGLRNPWPWVCRLMWLGLGTFVAVVVAEHVLDGRLDPSRHQISEYANGPYGWLMVVGFLAWAVSLAALGWLIATSDRLLNGRRRLLAVLLGIAAAGLAATAIFPTQTSAGRLPVGVVLSTSGRLHDAGSGLALLGLFLAVSLSTQLTELPRWLRVASGLAAVTAVAVGLGLLLAGDPVPGVRQRALVALAVAWQGSMGARCRRASRVRGGAQRP